MILYSKEQLNKLQKKLKRVVISDIIVAVFTLALSVLLCLLANDKTAVIFQVVLSVAGVLSGWYILGCFLWGILPLNRQIKFTKAILKGEKQRICGEISKIGETITFSNIPMTEVEIVSAGITGLCYWESGKNIPFHVDDTVVVETVNSKIYSCEVISHE